MQAKFFKTQAHFRKWLEKNHTKKDEQWVGYYKKKTGRPSITWPQSVDEALCYGWIDGKRQSIDEETYRIRFTPRRHQSIWSTVNLKRFSKLQKARLVHAAGLEKYNKRSEKRSERYAYEQGDVKMAAKYEKQIKANKKAWEFYCNKLPPSAKKPSIWWVMSARQEATRERRLRILIECSEQGLRIPPIRRR